MRRLLSLAAATKSSRPLCPDGQDQAIRSEEALRRLAHQEAATPQIREGAEEIGAHCRNDGHPQAAGLVPEHLCRRQGEAVGHAIRGGWVQSDG